MEEIIHKSLSGSPEDITQAQAKLLEILRSDVALQQFWSVVVSSNNVDIRQSAVIYFYRLVQKKKKWMQLPTHFRDQLKASVLERIQQEPEKKVKTVIVQAAGQIASMEPDNWPELFRLIEEAISCEGVPEVKELGLFVISILTEYATSLFELHIPSLLNLFASILTKPENSASPIAYLAVISMKNLLMFYPKKDKMIAQSFELLIPFVFEVVKGQTSRNRPDRAHECLTFFDALLDSYPRIVTNNLKNIIEGLLRMAVILNVDEISSRVLDVISCIICQKTKKIAKDEAILSMLSQTLFEIISSSRTPDDPSDHYDVYNGDVNMINTAVDVLDTLATEIEPELLMKHVMPILDAGATSDNVFARKAVYIILGVMVEKCSQQIRGGGIDRILLFIKDGLGSEHALLLNGALFTLWRFVEYFKPDINLFLLDFITPLLQLISDPDGKLTRVEGHLIPRVYYILSECCEVLESALEPVLRYMVPILLGVIQSNTKVHYRELAISVLGQAAVATKKSFRDYFPSVLEVLRPFLVDNLPADQLPLQVQTFDTLGTLFKSLYVKGEEFQLVIDVLNLTIAITEQKNCGELRAGLYSMLSDCSGFMKEKMEPYIQRILKLMVMSFDSKDIYDGEENERSSAQNMNVDMVSKDKKTIPVKDLKIIEEKEEALMALGNLGYNIGGPFQPYLHESFHICHSLSSHENQVIRAAAVDALANLYIAIKIGRVKDVPGSVLVDQLISKFHDIVTLDENVDVVYAVLEGYQKILNDVADIVNISVGSALNGMLIASSVKAVITEKCVCQKLKIREDDSDEEDDEDEEVDDGEEEIEDNYTLTDLIIAAGEVIPLLGVTLSHETFVTAFSTYQRHLLKLLKKHQPSEVRESTTATLGLCTKYLGDKMNMFALEFAPMFPTLMRDAHDNVRNNIAYCMAQMIFHGKEAMFSYYNDIVISLLNWLQFETCSMVVDNICGSIASMISTNKNLLPLDNIVPVFFRYLPLREDFDENEIVFKAINVLFEDDRFKDFLPRAVEIILSASLSKQVITDGTNHEVNEFFQRVSKCFPNEKERILQNLPDELRSHFVAFLLPSS